MVLWAAAVPVTASAAPSVVTASAARRARSAATVWPLVTFVRRSVDAARLAVVEVPLGDRARALEACRNALRIAPENPDGLMLYGHLNFQPLQAAGRTSFSGRFHDRLPPIEQPIFQLN
jgi:hypothetical protein